MPAPPLRVFVSYSHEDEPLKNSLRKHLSGMERRGLITVWDDRAIPAGGHWENEIRQHLEAADLVLLLISASFIASDYCYGEEMQRAVERHAAGEALLVPVLMRPCQWDLLPFVDEHRIQMLPRDARPVTDRHHWGDQDEALTHVAQELLKLVRPAATADAPATVAAPPAAPVAPPAAASQPDIPPLVADLCDRNDQDTAFDVALRASLQQPARRPFLFVLHGEDGERLHGFRDRLAQVRIPRVLDLARTQTSVEALTLQDLVLAVYRDPAEALRAELGERLLGDRGATVAQLAQHASQHPPTLLLVSHFVGREGLAQLRKSIAGILEFWSRWPDLATGRSLLHCLSVRFERAAPDTTEPPPSHEDTRRLLRRLVQRDGRYKDHPQVAGTVLPELTSVQRWQVEQWAESVEVRRVARIAPEDVGALFEQARERKADGAIPMEPLHRRIHELAVQRRL